MNPIFPTNAACAVARLRFLARCLLVAMLVTVLAPGFAWQVAGGVDAAMLAEHAPHGEPAHDAHHHGDLPGMADRLAAVDACAGCDEATGENCGDAHCVESLHHCCPGHVFSHLSASFLLAGQTLFPVGAHLAVDRENRRFSTRVPEGIERPPRHFSA